MKRKGIALVLALLTALGMNLAQANTAKKRFQASYLDLFDTVTSILGYETDEEAFQKVTAEIYDELLICDHLYDIYHEYPDLVNLCTINAHPGEALEVDQRIIDLLLVAREADQFSGHRMDVTLGAVLRIWHEARENGINHPESAYVPDLAELKAAKEHTGFDLLEIAAENCTVKLLDPETSLDVGALGKGYAVQRVCERLPEGYLLSVGGNVVATGPKPDGSPWVVGVQDPEGRGEGYLHKVNLVKGAVVTSGDYQRLYEVDGKAYHHIIDPETLFPGEKWRGVTVITEDSGLADAMSTSLFLMEQEEGQQLLDQMGAVAMWIGKDGKQLFSPGYEAYIKP